MAISRKKREDVFQRDGWRCVYTFESGKRCKVQGSAEDYSMLTIEHIQPKVAGGGDEFINLETMCREHNQVSMKEWIRENVKGNVLRRREVEPIRVIDLVPGAYRLAELFEQQE